MRKLTTTLLIVLVALAATPFAVFAYNPDDRFVDVATAKNDVSDRQQEIQRLQTENEGLVKTISDNENYIAERTDKLDKVKEAITRMNEAIADMLRIMGNMTDKAAAEKFKQSISDSRDTRDKLVTTRGKLENQITQTQTELEQNRTQLSVNRAKISKLNGEIDTLNTQIARTEEQQKKLDYTIQQAQSALADIQKLVNDIGSVD